MFCLNVVPGISLVLSKCFMTQWAGVLAIKVGNHGVQVLIQFSKCPNTWQLQDDENIRTETHNNFMTWLDIIFSMHILLINLAIMNACYVFPQWISGLVNITAELVRNTPTHNVLCLHMTSYVTKLREIHKTSQASITLLCFTNHLQDYLINIWKQLSNLMQIFFCNFGLVLVPVHM